MRVAPAEIGTRLEEIGTPALIVDLDAFERNLDKMAAFARQAGVRLRPHAKTHKSPVVALKQIARGAVGNCCQTVGEAEALVRGGVRDVLVSNMVVDPRKLRRLAALAADATVGICFDMVEQVDAASAVAREYGVEFGGLVEIELGTNRCGVAPGETFVAMARRVAAAPGLRFRGIQAYYGTAQHMNFADRERAIREASDKVRTTLAALDAAGLRAEFVSGAGTGTFRHEAASGLWNELQAGSYAFMDVDYAKIGDRQSDRYTEFEHSLFVLASVISVPAADRAVADAGLKSISGEKGPPWVHGRDEVEALRLADEHAMLRVGPRAKPLRPGDRLMLIPGHCDPTINLHDWYVGVRRGRVEALWPITARGGSG
jgi:D-serine deaminase-like pyridoxal phosphate-dependent protein